MKTLRAFSRRVFRLILLWAGRALHPRNALPCVGLVVRGGCLTMIISPDETAPGSLSAEEMQAEFPLVILDPGHGGKDDGTMWRGVAERHLSLDLAYRLQRLLKTSGFRTKLTRDRDVFVSLDERTRLANAERDAIFISLHFNSESTTTSSGIETYFPRDKEVPPADWTWIGIFDKGEAIPTAPSEELAGAIQTSLLEKTGSRSRGIHPSNFYVIHHTRCPSVLVEGGFISNPFEAQLLSTPSYRETLAQGITDGVVQYQRARQQKTTFPPSSIPEVVRQ